MGTIQIDGSTPKITIGNATAEDTLILFDGAAQDFYIGLDDSEDDLVIGVGSAVGTTPAIQITEDRAVTIAAEGIPVTVGGIPFFADASNDSIYTHDVSGTDDTATSNTAYGIAAMDAITTGDRNTALGQNAASALTTGANNVFCGRGAGILTTTGDNNQVFGYSALGSNVTARS